MNYLKHVKGIEPGYITYLLWDSHNIYVFVNVIIYLLAHTFRWMDK